MSHQKCPRMTTAGKIMVVPLAITPSAIFIIAAPRMGHVVSEKKKKKKRLKAQKHGKGRADIYDVGDTSWYCGDGCQPDYGACEIDGKGRGRSCGGVYGSCNESLCCGGNGYPPMSFELKEGFCD